MRLIKWDRWKPSVEQYWTIYNNIPSLLLNWYLHFFHLIGELYLTNSLDYERTPRYFLTIEAKDSGSPPLSTTTVATINVVDENDNSPYFIGQDVPLIDNSSDPNSSPQVPEIGIFSFEVYENSPVGTQIGRVSCSIFRRRIKER